MTEPELSAFRGICVASPELLKPVSGAGQRLLLREDAAKVVVVSDDGTWQFRTNDFELRSDAGAKGDATALRLVLTQKGIADFLCYKRNEAAVMSGVGRREPCTLADALKASGQVSDARVAGALHASLGASIERLDAGTRGQLLADPEVAPLAQVALLCHTKLERARLDAVANETIAAVGHPTPALDAEAAYMMADVKNLDSPQFTVKNIGGKAIIRIDQRPGMTLYGVFDTSKLGEAPKTKAEWYSAAKKGNLKLFLAEDASKAPTALSAEAVKETIMKIDI
jgi:hypothetical protein